MTILLIVLLSGCTQTGEIVSKSMPDNSTSDINETESKAQETTVEQGLTTLCDGMVCGETITTCPDGFISTCTNPCDSETGECVPCKPGCEGHEKPVRNDTECNIWCDYTKCEVLDEKECECSIALFCDGNGICEQGEFPVSEDCPECDDNYPCTEDSYDYEKKSCVYETISPCCGNTECEEGEDESGCPEDCLEEQAGDVRITYINYDAEGDDRKKENWNGEWIELEGHNVIMTDWTLEDVAGHLFTFPTFMINGKVKIHSGDGENSETDLFWNGGRRPIWNNDGDTATLKDSSGKVIDIYSY